ncbi:unnamed protein product [Didymodactylos carnosus]|uniref:Uncharacterized protein n=1 Tax=Didymodactylos carnosus TaxID=1234261 RepID=A0A814QSZ6_9BILA|nr:unnamed protein product [Didymodactylos carnosus]CAF1124687.1 unnamed protein product [Didymodactylos carnosus]CAF3714636.1 unnamed protein product [Didymodactylos carnosus]CAF3888175.1 unnamed protein product [Didymodactylos carnosus]
MNYSLKLSFLATIILHIQVNALIRPQTTLNAVDILNRYQNTLDENNDSQQLAHGLLNVLINDQHASSFISPKAVEIALKSLENQLGHDYSEVFRKTIAFVNPPVVLSPELTSAIKHEIAEALDAFFEKNANANEQY